MINITIGLILLIVANILFGTSLAKLKNEFRKEKFKEGIFKAISVLISTSLMYLCARMNPNILAIELNGNLVNLETAMQMLFTAGIIYYASQDISKLQKILNIKNSKEKSDE